MNPARAGLRRRRDNRPAPVSQNAGLDVTVMAGGATCRQAPSSEQPIGDPSMTSRRQFIQIVPVAGAALVAGRSAFAQGAMVGDKDPQAVALGYVSDATKADKAKYKNYAAGQSCSNCALFQGKPGDAAGPCPLFAGKQVSAKGWCSAWAKKA
jgi:hypothetical protein